MSHFVSLKGAKSSQLFALHECIAIKSLKKELVASPDLDESFGMSADDTYRFAHCGDTLFLFCRKLCERYYAMRMEREARAKAFRVCHILPENKMLNARGMTPSPEMNWSK
jgi:hypothetical protein